MSKLPGEVLAIITDNSGAIGHVQKKDIDEAARKGSNEGMFQKFLGLDDIKIACMCCITPRTRMTSTLHQVQAFESELRNKRIPRNTLKSLDLPLVVSASDWSMKKQSLCGCYS